MNMAVVLICLPSRYHDERMINYDTSSGVQVGVSLLLARQMEIRRMDE